MTYLFLSYTHEVLLETPVAAGLRLDPTECFVASLDRTDEIVHILPDENLEDTVPSLFEINIRDIEDREIQFDRSILVYSSLSGCRRSYIGSQKIELFNPDGFQELEDRSACENITLKERNIRIPKWFDLLDIDPDDMPG